MLFQPGKATGLDAVYHFTFTGEQQKKATVAIRHCQLAIHDGHQGQANMRVVADSRTWLGFVAKERSLLWALVRRKIRLRGSPRLLLLSANAFRRSAAQQTKFSFSENSKMATLGNYGEKLVRGEAPPPPIGRLLGFTPKSIGSGRAVFEMQADERHHNPMGTVHGGSTATWPMPRWALPMPRP